MYIEQIYTSCLAQGAYYIESNGEAAIIDPLRDAKPYLLKAAERKAKIKYVFETHFHADFISGHLDLANKCNATIVFGPTAKPNYKAHIAKDDEIFELGYITIKVIYTPGHTLESSCFLVCDENKNPYAIFTGDTLFIGDVGRPDLTVNSNLTQNELAGLLYESLYTKILPLPNEIIVYPAHGHGSACGKNMSNETYDTLGNQKKINYALKQPNKTAFINAITQGLLPHPYYFPHNAAMNKSGYTLLESLMENNVNALTPQKVNELINTKNCLILDTRSTSDFALSHIHNAQFIGIDGDFAPWVGTILTNIKQEIIVVCDPGREEEIITRLARVGYENISGYLLGGLEAWKTNGFTCDKIVCVNENEFVNEIKIKDDFQIIDVRKQSEFENGHVKNAINFPLAFLHQHIPEFNNSTKYYIYCAGGYRSLIACSLLKRNRITNLVNVTGGYNEIKNIIN